MRVMNWVLTWTLMMIDKGTTHLEIRMQGGSRTIIIPKDRDLLKDTKDIVNALSPLYSEAERMTLKALIDSTLCKSSVGLTLRVSVFVPHSSSFDLTCF